MTRTSKKTVETAAEVLNREVASKSEIGKMLTGEGENKLLGVINEILSRACEGGRLVGAVESDGTLLGFVPRSTVPIAEKKSPPAGPDDK